MMMAKQKKMSEFIIKIDGKEVKAAEGMTVLQAAQSAGIFIPTLCSHEKLEPYGACRICTVEIDVSGWTKLVAACLYPVEQDLVVKTRSEKRSKARDTVHSGNRREGVQFLQGMFCSLPDILSPGCFPFN
jgi:bidirectional [NiFe] hydrogenase diaphorase subunit